MIVQCDARIWRAFVRRARRRFPREYIEAAYGRVLSDRILICLFEKVEHIATNSSVIYDPEDIDKELPLALIGSIHTHPTFSDASPSETDWRDAVEHDERCFGILALWQSGKRIRSRGVFWPSTKPLDIQLT